MVIVLPNGKELRRPKGVKNKISPTKVATVHKRLLAILFDIKETTVARQFAEIKLSLKNPYAVKEYITRKLNWNRGLNNKRKKFRGEQTEVQERDILNSIRDKDVVYRISGVEQSKDGGIKITQIQRRRRVGDKYKYETTVSADKMIPLIQGILLSPENKKYAEISQLAIRRKEERIKNKKRSPS